jgi:hypothetical protein
MTSTSKKYMKNQKRNEFRGSFILYSKTGWFKRQKPDFPPYDGQGFSPAPLKKNGCQKAAIYAEQLGGKIRGR